MKNKEEILKRWEDFGFLDVIEKVEDKQELAELFELAAELLVGKQNEEVVEILLDDNEKYLFGLLPPYDAVLYRRIDVVIFPIIRRVLVKLKADGVEFTKNELIAAVFSTINLGWNEKTIKMLEKVDTIEKMEKYLEDNKESDEFFIHIFKAMIEYANKNEVDRAKIYDVEAEFCSFASDFIVDALEKKKI